MINVAVEGESDTAAAKAIVSSAGREVHRVVVAGGKARLDLKIPKYNTASKHANWVVFRDSDGVCPVEVRNELTAGIAAVGNRFCLRIAHSMTEAWLLADREGFCSYFGVKSGQLPRDPEGIAHAKTALLELCSKSKSKAIRREVVTVDGNTGPLYVTRLNEFASTHWNVATAADNSPSLASAIAAIRRLP